MTSAIFVAFGAFACLFLLGIIAGIVWADRRVKREPIEPDHGHGESWEQDRFDALHEALSAGDRARQNGRHLPQDDPYLSEQVARTLDNGWS